MKPPTKARWLPASGGCRGFPLMGRRRALLMAALGFLQLRHQPPEVAPLRQWLNSWAGIGAVVTGMERQSRRLATMRAGAPCSIPPASSTNRGPGLPGGRHHGRPFSERRGSR
jgi:hypothetical protein